MGTSLGKLSFCLLTAVILAACSRSIPAPIEFGKADVRNETKNTQTRDSFNGNSYIVKADETLYSIARRSGITLRQLIAVNHLEPPFRLYRGQRLRMPTAHYYQVASGDTLYSISRRRGVSPYALAKANGLQPPYRIRAGQRLRLPAGKPTIRLQSSVKDKKTAAIGKLQKGDKNHRGIPKLKTNRAAINSPPPRSGNRFAWPVKGRVISRFGVKRNGLHNDGINIAVERGTAVKAADNGVVVYAGNELRGFGNLLLLRHSGGWLTAYGHNEFLMVKIGDVVRRGQQIARSGSTGNINRPQLHFEIRRGKKALNPVQYLSS